MANQTIEPTVAIPLPRFRQPISDPPLPEVESTATAGPSSDGLPPATSSPPEQTSPEGDPPPPPVLSPDPRTRTGISSRAAGDPKVAGEVIAGLIAIGCLWAFTLFGRRRLHFRQPTTRQVDDVATPLGNIAARYLPTEVIGRDLVDATHAAAGVHRYVIDGPLLTRYNEPLPEETQ
jgi:hypothetical protein